MRFVHTLVAVLVAMVVLPAVGRSGSVLAQLTITVEATPVATPVEGATVELTVEPAEVVEPAEGPTENGQPEEALSPEAQRQRMIEQQAAQFEPMIRRHLEADLELLRTLQGDLPLETRRAIGQAGEQAVKDAALCASEAIHAAQQPPVAQLPNAGDLANAFAEGFARAIGLPAPRPKPPPPRAEASPPDPFDALRAALMASVVEQVGEEGAATFAEELSKRDERRQRAIVRRLVASLEAHLFLTTKQQDEIEAALGEAWQEGIAIAAESQMEMNGRKIYLGLPYELVLPHLTAAQQAQLGDGKESRQMEESNRQHRLQSRIWRQMNMMNMGQPAERDPWWFE